MRDILKAAAYVVVRRLLAYISAPLVVAFFVILLVLAMMSAANFIAFPANDGGTPILADAYPKPEEDKALLKKYQALVDEYQLADAYDLGKAEDNPEIPRPPSQGSGNNRSEALMAFGVLPSRPNSQYVSYSPGRGPVVKVANKGSRKKALDDYRGTEESPYEISQHDALEWGMVHYPCLMYAYQAGLPELPDDDFKEKTARDMHSYLFYNRVTLCHYAYYPPGPDGKGGGSDSWDEEKSVLVEVNGPAFHYAYTYAVVREYWESANGAHGYDDRIVPLSAAQVRKVPDKWLRDWIAAVYDVPKDRALGITTETVWQGSIAYSTRKENIAWLAALYRDVEDPGAFAATQGIDPNLMEYIKEAAAYTGMPEDVLTALIMHYFPALSALGESGDSFDIKKEDWLAALAELAGAGLISPAGSGSPEDLYQAYSDDPRVRVLVAACVFRDALAGTDWNGDWQSSLAQKLGPEAAAAVQHIYQALNSDSSPVWPLAGQGVITSYYGEMRPTGPHKGVDIAAPHGTPVRAALSGIVSEVGHADRWNGNYVRITTLGGLVFSYCHLDEVYVQPGQQVISTPESPAVIGTVGNTGHIYSGGQEIWNADGSYTQGGYHLHFQVNTGTGGETIDPLGLFR